jgi:chromodomain-helicase-DNA-binding protein 4
LNRLLDREQVGDEETSLDDEEEDGFLKAFKVFFFLTTMLLSVIC